MVCLIRYIKQNFAKIIHDVALAIERHNAIHAYTNSCSFTVKITLKKK